jgi:hypothetical protein
VPDGPVRKDLAEGKPVVLADQAVREVGVFD